MNSAISNDRSLRFNAMVKALFSGDENPQLNNEVVQLAATRGVIYVLWTSADSLNLERPILMSSNPWEKSDRAIVSPSENRINTQARWAGAKVLRVLDLWAFRKDEDLAEAIRAMIISLRYPFLNPEQVKEEHRELLARYGYFSPSV